MRLLKLGRARAAILGVAAVVVGGFAIQATPVAAGVTSTSPDRVLDTREGLGAPLGKVQPGTVLTLAIPAAKAAGASSVMLNLTATEADGPGWVKAWPCGEPMPSTSSLNFVPDRISANAVAVKLGGGAVCLATHAPVHLVADVSGWFTGSADITATSPNRLLDTRETGDPLQAGSERRLTVAGVGNIPAGAQFVAVNLTAVEPPTAGWVAAYPCGTPTSSSTVNFNAGEIVANLTVVAVAGGDICLSSLGTTNIVVDTFGWSAGNGEMKVQSPQRLLDTRDGSTWPFGQAQSRSRVTVQVAGRGGVPLDASAALLTVTVANPTGPGYVTTWPCDAAFPLASTINTWAGLLRSNLALVRLAADGTACLQVTSLHETPLDLVVEAVGWQTGGPSRQPGPARPVAPSAPPGSPGVTIPSGPLGGPGCSLASAAFCDTFTTPANGGTRTGDLDPVLWGVSRLGDINPGKLANTVATSRNACGGAAPPPADVRICNGQMLESVNDGGGVASLDTYPKQPFNFAGRTGTVVFDVSADSEGSHAAWPEFVITDDPLPGVRRSISEQDTPKAQNMVGFSIDGGCTGQANSTGVGAIFWTVDGVYGESSGNRPNCITKGSRLAMNHFEVRVSQHNIAVYGTDAGSTALKLLASENLDLAFTQGLVWLNDVHYNARKAVLCGNGSAECGSQYDHTFAWDNLGFDGVKTYRDLGYDVPEANRPAGVGTEGDEITELGWLLSSQSTFSVTGVRWDQTPTKAKVVFNTYTFTAGPTSVTLNNAAGCTATMPWRATDSTYGWRSLSIEVPVGCVRAGTNTLTIGSASNGTTVVSNISLILVAGAAVP